MVILKENQAKFDRMHFTYFLLLGTFLSLYYLFFLMDLLSENTGHYICHLRIFSDT